METESGFSILSANTSNTDLRTLADLATMGEKVSSAAGNHATSRMADHTSSGNGTGEDDSPRPHITMDSLSAQESIAKAFDRYC